MAAVSKTAVEKYHRGFKSLYFRNGQLTERPKELVLKTGEGNTSVGSNPTLPALVCEALI